MAVQLKAIEKLAREICWQEFGIKPTWTTRAAYWFTLSASKRAEYIRDAEWLIWITPRVATQRILTEREYKVTTPRTRRGR